ncbi:hypothetical protein BKA83DRAFT_4281919 [Pisolithus microcarpus]|nr:hypothetical protein BKA83DRAFT_4281919 [Pisolithus microcarpus]
MKRAADNQLTKDNHNDDDDGDDVQEVAQPTQGFQKADESALATRQIRALPKRALAGAAVKATSFNGFTSTPTSPAAGPDKEASTFPKFASFAGFGAGTSTPSSSFTFTVQPPATVPTPPSIPSSGAGSNFLSIPKLPQSSTWSDSPNGTLPKQSTHTTVGENGDATALKYYKSLRGLNPPTTTTQTPALISHLSTTATTSAASTSASESRFPFGASPATKASERPLQFHPWHQSLNLPKPSFTFGTSKTDDSSMPKTSFTFGTTGSLSSKANSTDASTKPSEASSSSAFASNPDAPNFFATFKVPSTTPDISIKTISPSNPSASIFGSTGDKPNASKEPAKPSISGNASSSLTGSAFSSEQSISAFGTSPQKSSVFGFGKPAGSIGNPVGFGFGALAPKASDSGPAGVLKPSPAPEGNEETPPAEDDTTKSLATGGHDEEGEGEEGEETVHAVRCKVFKLTKADDKNEWKDLGVGILRLKKHKENSIRRVLMRNSSSGRILINFRLFSGLKPSLAKTSISFVGHENGAPASYRIRVKTEEQAVSLKHAMDREIAVIQATS